jgi:hypothetical protein
MKAPVLLGLLLLGSIAPSFAQTSNSNDTVTIKRSDLTKDQQVQLATQEAQQKIDQYGKWVGVGHEVGSAINESLSAVTVNADKFAHTGAGRAVIALVIWKVAGKDFFGFVVGFLFLFTAGPVWVWSYYKNCVTRRVLVAKEGTKEEWKLVNDFEELGEINPQAEINPLTVQRLLHFGLAILLGIFVSSAMFGCQQ